MKNYPKKTLLYYTRDKLLTKDIVLFTHIANYFISERERERDLNKKAKNSFAPHRSKSWSFDNFAYNDQTYT